MCVAQAGALLGQGGLLETLGDPLGTRKRREDDQKNRWAREDAIRDATFAHEKEIYGTNRGSMNVPKPGTGRVGTTGTPSSTRGGGRSRPGGNPTRAY